MHENDLNRKEVKTERNPLFDALRGIAILFILIHHVTLAQEPFSQVVYESIQFDKLKPFYIFAWYTWAYIGKFGNTLFIGISAFLLTSSFLIRKRSNKINWITEKSSRIYLPYLFMIPLSVLILTIFKELPVSKLELLTTLFGVQPFFGFWAGGLNGAWWYISLIISLYIIFPFLFKLVEKVNIYLLVISAYVINFLSFYLSISFESALPRNFSEFFLLNHIATIALAIAFAIHFKKIQNSKLWLLVVPILVIFFFFLTEIGNDLGFPNLTLEFFFSRNILFIIIFGLGIIIQNWAKMLKPLIWLGRYTYPIFLSNLLVLNVMWFGMKWNALFIISFFLLSCMVGWMLQSITEVLQRYINSLKSWTIYFSFILVLSFVFLSYKQIISAIFWTPYYRLAIDFTLLFAILAFIKLRKKRTIH